MVFERRQKAQPSTIFEFARLSLAEKQELINSSAVWIDTDFENDRFIHLYFLNGFFVEVACDPLTGAKTEMIPFRRGFRAGRSQVIPPNGEAPFGKGPTPGAHPYNHHLN